MKLRSISDWNNRKLYTEFVGPAGQVDPMGMTPPPAQPSIVPQPPVDAAPEQQPANAVDDLPQAYQRLIKSLGLKSPSQIMQIQQQFNTAVQQMLVGKNQGKANMNNRAMIMNARQGWGVN